MPIRYERRAVVPFDQAHEESYIRPQEDVRYVREEEPVPDLKPGVFSALRELSGRQRTILATLGVIGSVALLKGPAIGRSVENLTGRIPDESPLPTMPAEMKQRLNESGQTYPMIQSDQARQLHDDYESLFDSGKINP